MSSRAYKVSDVARLAGVSVRTLHHYDSIGLLVPSGRSEAGYRLYSEDDLLRLQQILIGRALGLSLEDVRRMIDGEADRRALLLRQREQLQARISETQAMIRSIDAALAILDGREAQEVPNMTTQVDFKAIFDGFDPSKYEQEARERWGHTDAYQESARRTRNYSEQDWRALKAEQDAIMRDAAAAFSAKVSPTDPVALDIAERHRLFIEDPDIKKRQFGCAEQIGGGCFPEREKQDVFHAASMDGFTAVRKAPTSNLLRAPKLTPY